MWPTCKRRAINGGYLGCNKERTCRATVFVKSKKIKQNMPCLWQCHTASFTYVYMFVPMQYVYKESWAIIVRIVAHTMPLNETFAGFNIYTVYYTVWLSKDTKFVDLTPNIHAAHQIRQLRYITIYIYICRKWNYLANSGLIFRNKQRFIVELVPASLTYIFV